MTGPGPPRRRPERGTRRTPAYRDIPGNEMADCCEGNDRMEERRLERPEGGPADEDRFTQGKAHRTTSPPRGHHTR